MLPSIGQIGEADMDNRPSDIATMLPHPGPLENQARLLLFVMRRMATAGLNDAHAAHALIGGFGANFRRPLVLLRALMAGVSRASTRKIMIAPCCCPRMTGAEAALVAAIVAATTRPRVAHARLCALLGIDEALGALASAQAVAQAFADLGRPIGDGVEGGVIR
jgi:hypothetical protein